MVFKGRTVLAFVLLALFAGSLLTMTAGDISFRDNASSPKASTTPQASASEENGITQKDLDKVEKTYSLIESNYLTKVNHDTIVNGAINGMLAALDDPYTTYMNQDEAKEFSENINSSFQGIGAECSIVDGKVTVMSPLKDSPAERAGIRSNDVISSVNGESLDGLTLNQAVMKIRGPKGTQVKLAILRAGSSAPIELSIVRDDIPLETVYGEMVTDTIGKIEITQFSTNTAERFTEELNSLEAKGMKGLIIDVRDDPGGLLQCVIDIAEHFVPKGKPILNAEDRDGNRQPYLAQGKYPLKTYPVTVLTNGGSASASEILAAAIRESAGGKLIGEKTYGKGTVQVTYEREMGDGSNIKMTINKWLTPDGNWIHKKGIEPDVAVSQPEYFRMLAMTMKETLKPDTVSDEVKKLQVMLQAVKMDPGREDGYYSDKTTQAVKAFQKKSGLKETGLADQATMTKLEEAVVQLIRDPKNDEQLKAAVKATEDRLK
ncbi:S41 family peptidase [Gorillibacterium massiliense]|uniref:S41 family peptidase n=1 Tax=Gorillibacterium massiliense TaxID=1280390 RepID=UPI0004B4A2D2|nr:S41 family peptidase [Gorillibacterium massiliense]